MNGAQILDTHRDQLAPELLKWGDGIPSADPLDISPWLAMSLMQKAVRRGREDLALRATATLLRDSPDRFWRRACVTVFEDIGVSEFETVALVTAALKGKTWRAQVGGEWTVASYLAARMANAVKCRAADDLGYVCEHHPACEGARLELTYEPVPDLLDRIDATTPLAERAIALWYAVGTDRFWSTTLRERRGEFHAVLDALCERGMPESVVEVIREGCKKSNEILTPFVALLWREAQGAKQRMEADDLPPEELIGEVPCWAFDMHVREGNQAMARFLETGCETARWIAEKGPRTRRSRFLGNMLFRIESSLVDRRLRWEVGDQLLLMADLECLGLDPTDVAEGYDLLRGDLPILNEERRHASGSNLR